MREIVGPELKTIGYCIITYPWKVLLPEAHDWYWTVPNNTKVDWVIAFLDIVNLVKFWDCPTLSNLKLAYDELILTIAEFPALPISTWLALLLDEIAPAVFTDATCSAVLLSTPALLFCKSVIAVMLFVLLTTKLPGILTSPSLSTDKRESETVAFADGVLSDTLSIQIWNLLLL